jgi:hypothetical protein
MRQVSFVAYGHKNVVAEHKTTIELTSQDFLTRRGTCIIGVRAGLTLKKLDNDIKELARAADTEIRLRLTAEDLTDEIVGHGGRALTYDDSISMVARTSDFQCGRTLMVGADKAASDIRRDLIERLRQPQTQLKCELTFISRQ